MTRGFIYDETDGTCIANIVDNKVLRGTDGKCVGVVENDEIYGLSGELVGHLMPVGTGNGTTLPDTFRKLLQGKE